MTGFALEVNEGGHCLYSRLLIKSDVEPIFSNLNQKLVQYLKQWK